MFAIAAGAIGSVSACGGGGGSDVAQTPPAPSSSTQALDTAQVLIQARAISETSDPYPVNDGALILTDTSETSEPLSVNGT